MKMLSIFCTLTMCRIALNATCLGIRESHSYESLYRTFFFSSSDLSYLGLQSASQRNNIYCIHSQRRQVYWPPHPEKRSRTYPLPSGKKCFVFNAKSDQDGQLQTVLCFVDSHHMRLMWLDAEEVGQLAGLMPRIRNYFQLYEAKAEEEMLRQSELAAIQDHPSDH